MKTFDVTAPTLDHFRAKTGGVAIEKSDKLRAARFGKIKGTHGVHWDWQVTLHKRHAGSLKDLQTVQENRQRVGRKDDKTVTFGRRNPKMKDLRTNSSINRCGMRDKKSRTARRGTILLSSCRPRWALERPSGTNTRGTARTRRWSRPTND